VTYEPRIAVISYEPLITIQSANRTRQVKPMLKSLSPLTPTWYVPADQAEDYETAGAKVRAVDGVMPMATRQLNAALDDGFSEGRIVITMDDDYVSSSQQRRKDGRLVLEQVSLLDVIRTMVVKLDDSDFLLAVNAHWNPNVRNRNRPVDWGIGIGGLMAHKPSGLRFDNELDETYDLDFQIQHHLAFGGLVRLRKYLIDFHCFDTSKPAEDYEGGFAGYRNDETGAKTVDYLNLKYPMLKFEYFGVNQSCIEGTDWRALAQKKWGK